ncbi:hypothetical protein CRUP_002489, partial [Coryphaenoides rupestris]
MMRHPSTDSTPSDSGSTPSDSGSTPSDSGSTPSDSGSTPSDSGSTPSPSTPQKPLPVCTSPFGPRLLRATPSHSVTPRPQPEGSDYRHSNNARLSGRLGGHGPCGRHVPVLTGSEVESDYKEPDTMDTRVVMGQETLLKTSEIQEGKTKGLSNSQAIPLPGIPGAAAPLITTMTDTQMDTTQKERQSQSPKRGEDERKEQPPNSFPSPLLTTLLPVLSSSTESITA